MRTALVTGAGGFLAGHVAAALADDGWAVRGIVRPGSPARAHVPAGVELVEADLTEAGAVIRASAGVDAVFHVAASYSLSRRRGRSLERGNAHATSSVLAAVRFHDVPLVHTSSVATIGLPAGGGLGDETTPLPRSQVVGAYKRSKLTSERMALGAAADGVHVIAVNPTAPVGPGDWRPTPTGRVIRDAALGRMPATVRTGLNVVHAADVARGHLLALERGVPGRRYILGGENLTLAQIVATAADATGARGARATIPHGVAIGVAAADELVEGWILGREPAAPLDGALMARKTMWVSDARARRELGYTSRPAAEAIREAALWMTGRAAAESR